MRYSMMLHVKMQHPPPPRAHMCTPHASFWLCKRAVRCCQANGARDAQCLSWAIQQHSPAEDCPALELDTTRPPAQGALVKPAFTAMLLHNQGSCCVVSNSH
jgi:hypothetical protein